MSERTHYPAPLQLYGSSISYFTGKLENYFRVKGIPYDLYAMTFPRLAAEIAREVGVQQMPALKLPDGRWMTDTTAIIEWLEAQQPEPELLTGDPVMDFVCYLIEDWADEWLWRPAMHYRWYSPGSAELQSRHLADELVRDVPIPNLLKRWNLRRRQRSGYTMGDGVTEKNRAGVEATYLSLLAMLEPILASRSYLLGDRPSLADIGLSGPFFRHFALDPVPLAILRAQAPSVLEWVARLWNTTPARIANAAWPAALPDDLGPLLDTIGRGYLPYLNANARAVAAGQRRFDCEVDGVFYPRARTSKYRVWCLKRLRDRVELLDAKALVSVKALLDSHGLWQVLWEVAELPISDDQESGLPFRGDSKMLAVYD